MTLKTWITFLYTAIMCQNLQLPKLRGHFHTRYGTILATIQLNRPEQCGKSEDHLAVWRLSHLNSIRKLEVFEDFFLQDGLARMKPRLEFKSKKRPLRQGRPPELGLKNAPMKNSRPSQKTLLKTIRLFLKLWTY